MGRGKDLKPRGPQVDITNKRFHHLVALSYRGKGHWLCRCDCGNTKLVRTSRLTCSSSTVRSCGCQKQKQRGNNNSNWKGVGDLSGYRFGILRRQAKRRNIDFDLTIDELWDCYQKQQGKCALSGIPITFKDNSASPDRINPNGGYTVDNIQIVHKDINYMKWTLAEERFVELCKLVANTSKTPVLVLASLRP